MTSRPMILVFLLLILIITSQFEWKQQLVSDLDSTPSISQKQQHTINKEEEIKEKIVGALWYLLAVEREDAFWHKACNNLLVYVIQVFYIVVNGNQKDLESGRITAQPFSINSVINSKASEQT